MSIQPFKPKSPDSFYSEPNILTVIRLVLSLAFFTLAIVKMNPTFNFIGLGIHWLGDVADGMYARRLKQETILGAEIDIISDRVEILFFYVNFLHFNPQLFLPAAVYIVEFAFIDFYLSYQFLKHDIISPNYFYKVDQTFHLLNYSPPAKFVNSTIVTLILIFLPRLKFIALIVAVFLIGLKIYSIFLLNKKTRVGKKIDLNQENPG